MRVDHACPDCRLQPIDFTSCHSEALQPVKVWLAHPSRWSWVGIVGIENAFQSLSGLMAIREGGFDRPSKIKWEGSLHIGIKATASIFLT
jgi:hypothetical protein